MEIDPKDIPTLVKDQRLIETRRRQIIDAGVRLIAKKGFHKTTTREIAYESGFSIGTLYEYIESKEDILFLVCDAIHSQIEAKLREVTAGPGNGYETLKRAIEGFIRGVDELDDEILLIYQEIKSLPKEMMSYVLRREEELTDIFAGIIHKGNQDGSIHLEESSISLMAHNIMVLGEMWTFRRWALRKRYTLEEFVERQTALLLREVKE